MKCKPVRLYRNSGCSGALTVENKSVYVPGCEHVSFLLQAFLNSSLWGFTQFFSQPSAKWSYDELLFLALKVWVFLSSLRGYIMVISRFLEGKSMIVLKIIFQLVTLHQHNTLWPNSINKAFCFLASLSNQVTGPVKYKRHNQKW